MTLRQGWAWGLALAAGAALAGWRLFAIRNVAGGPSTPTHGVRASPPPVPAGPVRMVAVGDLMLGTPTRAAQIRSARHSVFEPYRAVIESADLAFGNLETPVSERGAPTPGKSPESLRDGTNFIFRAPPSAADAVARAGFDVVSVANNHAMDYGPTALRDTLSRLGSAGVRTVGGGDNLEEALAPVILVRRRQRFAVFGVSDVLPAGSPAGDDTTGIAPARGAWFEERMPAALAEARKRADWLLVSVHWGREKFTGATEKQRRLGRRLIDWGADVVIGHHTHCLGPVERYRGGLIHYSLGNFIGPRRSSRSAGAWQVVFQRGQRPTERMLRIE